MRRITRRRFLVGAAGVAAAYGLVQHLAIVPAVADALPSVAVAKGTNADSAAAILKTALDGLGGIGRFVKPGQTVAIKPNATWDYPPGTASSTDPDVLRTLIQMVREAGAKRIIVTDHPTLSSAADCLEVSGIGAVVDSMGVEKVFPDRALAPAETYTTIDLPEGKTVHKIGVIKAALEADVRINMAVAKGHVVQGIRVTMCLKHMMGFLENPPALHATLFGGICDINTKSPIQAQLHILEAIRVRGPAGTQAAGYETDLTNPKRVKRVNQIVAGTDPVLIDSYGCVNYFSFQPAEVQYVKLAGENGLGETDVNKAMGDGRMRVFTVGQGIPTASPTPTTSLTPTASPTATAAPTAAPTTAATAGVGEPTTRAVTVTPTNAPATPTIVPTHTPQPTATLEPMQAVSASEAGAGQDGARPGREAVVNPNAFLSGALVPVAAIVAGAGLLARQRLSRGGKPGEGEDAS